MFLFVALVVTFILPKESNFELENPCEFIVSGTSTIHNWHMKCTSAASTASLTIENEKIKDIKSAQVVLKSECLKSEDRALDKNAYRTLKATKHPEITFTFLKLNSNVADGNSSQLSVSGFLSIAGTKKSTVLNVKASVTPSVILIEGKTTIKFSDFELDPPEFFFGTVKAGNDITITFKVKYRNTNSITNNP